MSLRSTARTGPAKLRVSVEHRRQDLHVDARVTEEARVRRRLPLDVGDSFNFDFFNLNFWGTGLGSGSITASLGFDAPTGSPNANGSGGGGFLTLFGHISAGYLSWDDFSPITLGDGTSFLVEFEDLVGIDDGTVTVGGRISLLSNAASVPEPGTLMLFRRFIESKCCSGAWRAKALKHSRKSSGRPFPQKLIPIMPTRPSGANSGCPAIHPTAI